MAYKVFSNGDALTGGELNTYLMNQSVIQFASTTARDAAIPAPSEGQLVWLQDSNKYVYYTGSAWSDLITPASSGNAIINGAFEINQRNFTSTTTNGTFGFDRWYLGASDGTTTYSTQAFTPGTAPVSGYEGTNFARLVSSGQTLAGAFSRLHQKIEDVRSFAGQTVTLSFFAKAASGTPKMAASFYTNFGSGGSTGADVLGGTVTLSTSWARYSLTVAIPSVSGKTIGTGSNLELILWTSSGASQAAAQSIGIQSNTFDIWGVQLESGSTATAFKRNASNIQGELAACQRYYQRITATTSYSNITGAGSARSTTSGFFMFPHKTTFRTSPTSIEYSAIAFDDGANSLVAATSITLAGISPDCVVVLASASSGLTQYRPYTLIGNNNAAAYIGVSAEL